MRLRLAFLGSPEFAVPSLQGLASRHEVALVVTQPERPGGRGLLPTPTAVHEAATALHLPVVTVARRGRQQLEDSLRPLALDVLVVVAFGQILRQSTWETARRGALNVHASLLPRWRGVAPIERALLAGDTSTGVSLMVIEAGVDTGPVLARQALSIEPESTRAELTARLAAAGAALLLEHVEAYVAGSLVPEPQDATAATYASALRKEEGRIDWGASAAQIARQVRAFAGWPGTATEWAGVALKVHAVRVANSTLPGVAPGTVVLADPRRGVQVACGEGVLDLLEVQLPGKARVPARTLVQGRGLVPGQVLGIQSHGARRGEST